MWEKPQPRICGSSTAWEELLACEVALARTSCSALPQVHRLEANGSLGIVTQKQQSRAT